MPEPTHLTPLNAEEQWITVVRRLPSLVKNIVEVSETALRPFPAGGAWPQI